MSTSGESSSGEPAPAASPIGQVVGAYRVVSQLGAGGMGSVWLAEHTLLGRRVAIKMLLPEVSRQASMVERFFDEARAATRVDHPGIVAVHDFGWHGDGSAFIVMEHLVGESLAARLRRAGHLPADDALRIVQQAASAMAAAHGGGCVHRDLKPDNIFVVPDPTVTGGERIKILDFGIAKLIGTDARDRTRTQTGVIMGTPMYMSPEQCRDAGGVDHRTDIYSLGCVLFHLLTGRPPFTSPTTGDMIASHLLEEPPAPSSVIEGLPRAVDELVLRCLAKAAGDRPADMTELARAIARLRSAPESGIGLLATIAQERGRTLPPQRRRGPARVAVVLAVVVAALGAFVIARSLARREPAMVTNADAAATAGATTNTDDAALPLDDGPDASSAIDAPPPPDASPRRPDRRGRTRTGSGSASGEYDPYEDR